MRWSLRQKLLKFALEYLDILAFMIPYPEAQIGNKKPFVSMQCPFDVLCKINDGFRTIIRAHISISADKYQH